MIFDFSYVLLVFSMILLSLNLSQTNKRFEKTYNLVTSVLGWYSLLMYAVLIVQMSDIGRFLDTDNSSGNVMFHPFTMRIIIYAIIGMQIIPPLVFAIMKGSFKYGWEVLSSALSFLYYSSAYLHVLMIFAYCRIDDISWGTKGLTDTKAHNLMDAWKTEKQIFVSKFVFTNIILAVVLKMLCDI